MTMDGTIAPISTKIGVPPSVLRLILSMLLSYPVAYIFRFLLKPFVPKSIRTTYVLATSLGLAFIFCGWDILHTAITILFTWIICKVGGDILNINRRVLVAAVWIFNMAYLLVGYHYRNVLVEPMSWVTPHCVLCLRMIGMGMDYYDGRPKKSNTIPKPNVHDPVPASSQSHKPSNKNSPIVGESERKLYKFPSIIDTLAFGYFFAGWAVGPQYCYVHYDELISLHIFSRAKKQDKEEVSADDIEVPNATLYALTRLVSAGVLLGVHVALSQYFPIKFMLTETFAAWPLIKRLSYAWMWGKGALWKYIGIWQLVDGPIALTCLGFNGYQKDPVSAKVIGTNWNGLLNAEPSVFEIPSSLNDIVASFNINTNYWVRIYVFKRLRFLRNKHLSSLGALFFLAVWHGLHIGYFTCFFLEFLDVEAEREWKDMIAPITKWIFPEDGMINSAKLLARVVYRIGAYFWCTFALHYALISFDQLSWEPSHIIWSHLNWAGHLLLVFIYTLKYTTAFFETKKDKTAVNGSTFKSKAS